MQTFHWPIPPHWLYQRLRAVGYTPRNYGIHAKHVDHRALRITFTVQLPLKYACTDIERLKRDIKRAVLYHVIRLQVRKNKRWVGITITLDATKLTAMDNK